MFVLFSKNGGFAMVRLCKRFTEKMLNNPAATSG